jgi:hypothetical protein
MGESLEIALPLIGNRYLLAAGMFWLCLACQEAIYSRGSLASPGIRTGTGLFPCKKQKHTTKRQLCMSKYLLQKSMLGNCYFIGIDTCIYDHFFSENKSRVQVLTLSLRT